MSKFNLSKFFQFFFFIGSEKIVLKLLLYSVILSLSVVFLPFPHQVREVRTSDDTMLTVKVMLFYQMKDILKMVRNCYARFSAFKKLLTYLKSFSTSQSCSCCCCCCCCFAVSKPAPSVGLDILGLHTIRT